MNEYIVIALMIFMFFAGHNLGENCQESWMQKQAINANVAEWVIDSKTGKKAFKWKEAR